MRAYRPQSKILILFMCMACLLSLSPRAYAAQPTQIEPSFDEELLYERWKLEMEEIVQLFCDWSAYNGVYGERGYCTTNGKPFGVSTGDKCYIGNVSPAMRRAGLIDFTVTGGWSCNGFVRFAIRALYGRTFWRNEMTENIYTMSLFSDVDDVRDFLSDAKIGDMLCIMGYADHDNDGRVNDEYWHYMIYMKDTDEGVLVLDGNFDHDNGVQIHLVSWEFLMSRQWIYLYSVSEKDHMSVLDRHPDTKVIDPAANVGGGAPVLLFQ